jgi:iron-sulfur cluster assembly accessory protein
MQIKVTAAAEKFMRRMVRFSGSSAEAGFRLTVEPGGCSGLSSQFSVEEQARQGDATLDVNGLPVFLPAQSRLLLEGATVDFADTPVSSGLSFRLPKAAACACGSSAPGPASAEARIDISRLGRRG